LRKIVYTTESEGERVIFNISPNNFILDKCTLTLETGSSAIWGSIKKMSGFVLQPGNFQK